MSTRTLIMLSLAFALCALRLEGAASDGINLAEFDWNEPVNLTNNPHWDFDPDFSPDGTQIAFHSNRPPSPKNRGQIYVMNADGTDPVALTNTEQTNYMARWSPDGTKIAFVSERDGNNEIYLMNPDGTDLLNLTNSPERYDSGPDWSPDGRFIAYFSGAKKPPNDDYQPPGSPYRYWNSDLYIMNIETGERTQVTHSEMDDIYPNWSNAGDRLSFTSSRDGNEEIYVINIDGSGERRITNSKSHDKAPSWLPGDTALQFRNDAGEGEGDHSNIWVVELASGQANRITAKQGMIYFSAALAPDGESAIFSAFTQDAAAFRGERADIYRARKTSSGEE